MSQVNRESGGTPPTRSPSVSAPQAVTEMKMRPSERRPTLAGKGGDGERVIPPFWGPTIFDKNAKGGSEITVPPSNSDRALKNSGVQQLSKSSPIAIPSALANLTMKPHPIQQPPQKQTPPQSPQPSEKKSRKKEAPSSPPTEPAKAETSKKSKKPKESQPPPIQQPPQPQTPPQPQPQPSQPTQPQPQVKIQQNELPTKGKQTNSNPASPVISPLRKSTFGVTIDAKQQLHQQQPQEDTTKTTFTSSAPRRDSNPTLPETRSLLGGYRSRSGSSSVNPEEGSSSSADSSPNHSRTSSPLVARKIPSAIESKSQSSSAGKESGRKTVLLYRAEVLYNYNSQKNHELSIRKGQIILVHERDATGWWTGEIDSKYGLFPGSHVKVLGSKKPPMITRVAPEDTPTSQAPDPTIESEEPSSAILYRTAKG